MDISIRKSFDRKHPCTCVRADRRVVRFDMWEDGSGLPHDLVHYGVEAGLGMRFGFWGLIDAGAPFERIRPMDGSPLGGVPLIDEHRDELLEAEKIVGAVWDKYGDARTRDAARANLARFREATTGQSMIPEWWSEDAADRIWDRIIQLRIDWEAVDLGDLLRLTWPA